jgi:hypothetical protein
MAAADRSDRLGIVAAVLGVLSVALITIVSFIALVLALAAIVTGSASVARSTERRPLPIVGAILGVAAITFFIVHVM